MLPVKKCTRKPNAHTERQTSTWKNPGILYSIRSVSESIWLSYAFLSPSLVLWKQMSDGFVVKTRYLKRSFCTNRITMTGMLCVCMPAEKLKKRIWMEVTREVVRKSFACNLSEFFFLSLYFSAIVPVNPAWYLPKNLLFRINSNFASIQFQAS